MKNVVEIDFTESIAKVQMTCESCAGDMGNHYSNKPGSFHVNLSEGTDEYGYPKSRTHDFCSEACMLASLQKRAKKK